MPTELNSELSQLCGINQCRAVTSKETSWKICACERTACLKRFINIGWRYDYSKGSVEELPATAGTICQDICHQLVDTSPCLHESLVGLSTCLL